MPFENCLSRDVIESKPTRLQFVPLQVSARFNTTAESHNLNVTVYGNVTGSATTTPLPPPDDPRWMASNETLGKILDVSLSNNKYSTLLGRVTLLSYTPYQAPAQRFCESVVQQACPLIPYFGPNG